MTLLGHGGSRWRRHRSLLGLALGGGSFLILCSPLIDRAVGLVPAPSLWMLLPAAVLVITLADWLLKKPLSAALGFRHFARHPPGWLAAFPGAAFAQAGWILIPESKPERALATWTGVALTLIVGVAIATLWWTMSKASAWRLERTRDDREKHWKALDVQKPADLSTSFEELVNWLQNDLPIHHPAADRFALCDAARRVVHRLCSPSDESPTIAVVGALGAGKSSLLELVAGALAHRRGAPELVRVRLWQYESTEAAATGIIEELHRHLSQHINTVELFGLSARYVAAIEGASGVSGKLLQMLLGHREPSKLLEKISALATTIGIRLVLWVEDLERFANEGDDKLAPVLSLLFHLDRLPGLSVVLATARVDTGFDVAKLARFIERIPDLDRRDVYQILRTFKAGCLEHEAEPAGNGSRRPLEFEVAKEGWFAAIQIADGTQSPSEALAALVQTPRQLKLALREAHYRWSKLAGEIDFDDLLIMSVIRETKLGVFSVIDRYSTALSWGEPTARGDEQDRGEGKVRQRLLELLFNDPDVHHVLALVDFVFPKDRDAAPLQGLRSNARNYWVRFQAVPEISDADSDKKLFAEIEAFKEEQHIPSALARRFAAQREKDPTGIFCRDLTVTQLLRLLSEVVALLLTAGLETRNPTRPPPGVTALWSLLLRRRSGDDPYSEDEVERVLRGLIANAVPHDFQVAQQLVHWFAEPDKPRHAVISDDHCARVRTFFHEQIVQEFGTRRNNPKASEKLTNALRPLRELTLAQAIWGANAFGDKALLEGLPFDDWDQLRETLFNSARANPTVLLGPIAWLVARPAGWSDADPKGGRFHEDLAERLFGADQLLQLFSCSSVDEFKSEQTASLYRCIQTAARDERIRAGALFIDGEHDRSDLRGAPPGSEPT